MEQVTLQHKLIEWGFGSMNNTLYLECSAGISGDMFVAALLDLGADSDVLMNVLNHLPVKGFHITIQRVKKAGLDACDFMVLLELENHDHDSEFLKRKPNEHSNLSHEEAEHVKQHKILHLLVHLDGLDL